MSGQYRVIVRVAPSTTRMPCAGMKLIRSSVSGGCVPNTDGPVTSQSESDHVTSDSSHIRSRALCIAVPAASIVNRYTASPNVGNVGSDTHCDTSNVGLHHGTFTPPG